MSDANRCSIALVEESSWGVTPSSALSLVRHTGESLKHDQESTRSNELRSDRQVADLVRTMYKASGGWNFEWSYGGIFDSILKAALFASAWSSPVAVSTSQTDVSVSSVDNSFNDASGNFGSAVAGEWIISSGFANAANNGIFKVVSRTGSKIVVSGGTLVTESAGASVNITQGGSITNGTTVTSFSIEKQFEDLSNTFANYVGAMVDKFTGNISAKGILTGSVDFLAKKETNSTSTIGTGPNVAASTTGVMNAVDNVVRVLVDNASYDITSLQFTIANNLRERVVVGQQGLQSIGVGSVNITFTSEAYFSDSTLYGKLISDTPISQAIILKDASNNYYVLEFMRSKFASGTRNAGGLNQDVMVSLNGETYRHPTENKTMRIVRFPGS